MDDDDFHDLLGEAELLDGSSKELLTNPTVTDRIEKVFARLADSLLRDEDELVINLRRRPTAKATTVSVVGQNDAEPEKDCTRPICFPGKTAEEAWRFTVITRILELIHEALRTDVVLSKRDIYYRDPALFGSQSHVDRYVDDIAYTFGVQRSKLNVTAVAKGLIAGAVNFCRRDGSTFSASDDREGILLPNLREILSADMSRVKWILVIEKEATFRSIAASSFWSTVATEGVLVTGKGYPDIATRAMVHFLSLPSPRTGFVSPEVHGLVDFDPDGLAILSVYRDGSIALAHESANLRVPQMHWLGLRRRQFITGTHDVHLQQGLLHLTVRDRRKAVKMLERCDDIDMRSALQEMLILNIKAELQILDASLEGMVELLKCGLGEVKKPDDLLDHQSRTPAILASHAADILQ